MSCETTSALIGLVGVFLGLFIGNRLAWDTDDRNRRAKFSGAICGFRSAVDRVDDYTFPAWFSEMQVRVEEQCGLVDSAVGWRYRRRFAAARKECAKAQTQGDLADPRSPQFPVNFIPIGADYLPPMTYQQGRKRAAAILDSLLDVCK
jgi:hypothetical protein